MRGSSPPLRVIWSESALSRGKMFKHLSSGRFSCPVARCNSATRCSYASTLAPSTAGRTFKESSNRTFRWLSVAHHGTDWPESQIP